MSSSERHILRPGVVDPTAGTGQPWGWLNFVSELETTGVDGVTVGIVRIDADSENPLHIHGNCSEIILLLGGSVEHVVGSEVVGLTAGDMLIVPPGMAHKARSVGPGPAEMIVVYNSGQRGFELAERLPG